MSRRTIHRPNAVRKIEFDAGHRVLKHESKCRHVHGHRYVLEITAVAAELDDVGRAIDFGKIKEVCGGWVDTHLDHGYIAHPDDFVGLMLRNLQAFASAAMSAPALTLLRPLIRPFLDHADLEPLKVYVMPTSHPNPTAENMVVHLGGVFDALLIKHGVRCASLRLYETPNGWSEWHNPMLSLEASNPFEGLRAALNNHTYVCSTDAPPPPPVVPCCRGEVESEAVLAELDLPALATWVMDAEPMKWAFRDDRERRLKPHVMLASTETTEVLCGLGNTDWNEEEPAVYPNGTIAPTPTDACTTCLRLLGEQFFVISP